MSPRKSSTSSANPPSPRPRYLGLEVAGDQPVSPRWVERELARRLTAEEPPAPLPFRIIRWEGRRGLLQVNHLDVPRARRLFNATIQDSAGRTARFTTYRTWGTLRKGKEWLNRPSVTAPAEPTAAPGRP